MDPVRNSLRLGCLAAIVAALACRGWAGEALASYLPRASNVVVPQRRAFALDERKAVEITRVNVAATIQDQVATTAMEISLYNPSASRVEAELLVPLPDGAAVKDFSFVGPGGRLESQVLVSEEARRTYRAIVSSMRDPALLEFAGASLVRSSVFPVEPRKTQKIRLVTEGVLAAHGQRVDYVLPRSESLDYRVPWHVSVRIDAKEPVAAVYSPSHELGTRRVGKGGMLAWTLDEASRQPGPFRLSYLVQADGVTSSLFACPDPKGDGGTFLLLGGLPARIPRRNGHAGIRREVTLVLDRSGSMASGKLHQVREAAKQVLASLEPDESLNIIVYNESVESFADRPVAKSPTVEVAALLFLEQIRARGGTNLHGALRAALRQKATEGALPVVLFLTDGLPTVGDTSEVDIRALATDANPAHRRVFTFGVGVDVNSPLLDGIAAETRGQSTYVLPEEKVDVKVAQVFERLGGPVLADARLEAVGPDGKPAPDRLHDLVPTRLPDLYMGDQLVVLGRYKGSEPLNLRLRGNYLGEERDFAFSFGLADASTPAVSSAAATTAYAFVPRLWASRRIGQLSEAIRQLGAASDQGGLEQTQAADPRVKELVDEIVRLSIQHGILTEYTAFLALEGTDVAQRGRVLAQVADNYKRRAIDIRSGLGSVSQGMNNDYQFRQEVLNPYNRFLDENMRPVVFASVQQVSDRTFYRRGRRWIDSRLLGQEATVQPKRVIEFGSDEFLQFAQRLADEGRQGCIALEGDILLLVDGEPVLVKGPAAAQAAAAETQAK